jgi:hypothetical protein
VHRVDPVLPRLPVRQWVLSVITRSTSRCSGSASRRPGSGWSAIPGASAAGSPPHGSGERASIRTTAVFSRLGRFVPSPRALLGLAGAFLIWYRPLPSDLRQLDFLAPAGFSTHYSSKWFSLR